MTTELAIIIPTFNEKENIRPLLDKLETALAGVSWEAVFVDDNSSDDTASFVRAIARKDPRVRCLERVGRRGLSSACIEGMLSTSAPYLAVMDADLQHDETLLPKMLLSLKDDHLEMVVGSRYVDEGKVSDWSQKRILISQLGTKLSQIAIKVDIKDPLSGFFMIERSFFERIVHRLTGKGFKILLDICASSSTPVKFKELPFQFRNRYAGASKLDTMVIWEYGWLIIDKLVGRFVPVRFILFVMVGLLGAGVHLSVLGYGMKILSFSFVTSQIVAAFIAMTFNFVLNNIFTYHDLKLKGIKFIVGLLTFYVACSIGAFVNIQVAYFLFERGIFWWLSGLLGALIGAVWNFAITSTYTWSSTQSSSPQ